MNPRASNNRASGCGRGGGGSTNTTADDRDKESEHALYVANLAEMIDEKEDEISRY